MLTSMTAQGWRKRQIVDHAGARIKVLEAENAALLLLLYHAEYFVTHYGTTNALTNQEKQVKDAFLERIHTYTADPLKNLSTGL
jgi:hypothetical protein